MSLFQAYAQIVLLPLCSPQILSVFPKYVGLFSKNVGDFLKNVGLFPKNVGDFLNYLRRFFVFCALLLLVLRVVFFLFMRSFLLMHMLSMLPLLLSIALLRDDIL